MVVTPSSWWQPPLHGGNPLFMVVTPSSWCTVIRSEYHIHSKMMTNLKCVTLRFVNNMDMIETPLRSIIISGIWKSMTTPTYSTMI
jgi:hypothetical protein